MSTTSGLSSSQLKSKITELKGQGKTASTSKSLGKYIDALKVLEPSGYSDKTVASAQAKLNSSTQGLPGVSSTTTGTSGTSDLEQQLADKQAALVKATTNINDNPWYSEATRTGKLAKLNNTAQLEITNLQNQIAQQKTSEQNAFNNNIATQELALKQQEANKPGTSTTYQTDNNGNVTAITINTTTGAVISQKSLGAIGTTKTEPKDTSDAKQEAEFNGAIATGLTQLKQGESWGTVWDRIHSQFAGSIPDPALSTLIDNALGTAWRTPGAYQNYMSTQNATKPASSWPAQLNPGGQ
jgi:hypothetical protein